MELHHLGLSVSYHRVLQVENELANSVCQDFKKKGVVCPSQLCMQRAIHCGCNRQHRPQPTKQYCQMFFSWQWYVLKVYYEYVHPYEYQLFLQILFSTIVRQYFLYLSQYLFYLSSLFGLL